MGTSNLSGKPDEMQGGATLQWTCISSREGIMILLVTSYSEAEIS